MVEALKAMSPGKHNIVWDHDAAPTCLWEVEDILKRGLGLAYPHKDHFAGQSVYPPGMILISENNSMVNAGIAMIVRDTRFPAQYVGPGADVCGIHALRIDYYHGSSTICAHAPQ